MLSKTSHNTHWAIVVIHHVNPAFGKEYSILGGEKDAAEALVEST